MECNEAVAVQQFSSSATNASLAPTALGTFKDLPSRRFEKEVLGGQLWHPACRQAAGNNTEEIPLQVHQASCVHVVFAST